MSTEQDTRTLTLAEEAQDLLFRQARTANSFSTDPVTEEQVQAIYDLVKWAPTSMNTQPLRVLLVRSAQARATLTQLMSEGNRAKTGSAPLVAVLAADTDFHENLPTQFPHYPGAKDNFTDEPARAEFARFNALLQVGYFILGVRAAGLAAGPMTGFDAQGVDRAFFPDGRRKSLVVVNIGNPGESPWFDRNPRLDYTEVVESV
ncbi:malonic semialdehyde reductase [Actinokineospora pegani]|uniref:malonic semialdehyde reductase n=1 Tax=Actinokineospora pegani TaxID=2654637 RepID=UPI0012EA14FF|nr:malonic semialdehyde reductase [Actinokineospora pegani]